MAWSAITGFANACFVAFILNIAVFLVDVLNQSTVSLGLSAQYSTRLAAPFYRWFDDAETAGDLISIIRIGDDFLNEYGWEPPLDYYDQRDLLASILSPEAGAKPLALFLDLVYEQNRGGELPVLESYLASEAAKATVMGSDADLAAAFAKAAPTLGAPPAGILVADSRAELIPGTPRLDIAGPKDRHTRRSMIDAQGGMAMFAKGAPLRYFLAPDGHLSAAMTLMIWTCASSEQAAGIDACTDTRLPLTDRDVRAAAAAAATQALLLECRRLLYGEDGSTTTCATLQSRYLANLDWAPHPPQDEASAPEIPGRLAVWAGLAEPETDDARRQRLARWMTGFAIARRDGLAAGAKAFIETPCYTAVTGWAAQGRDPVRRETIFEDCKAEADKLERMRLGPTMYVLWASPSRSAPLHDDQARDPCDPYRHEKTLAGSVQAFWRVVTDIMSASRTGEYLDPCSYHEELNALHVYPVDKDITRGDGSRVVILSLNARRDQDRHPMRGSAALPGAWAHAMALDNLLTLGAAYRPASFDAAGIASESLSGRLFAQLVEFAGALLVIVLLIWMNLKAFCNGAAKVLGRITFGILEHDTLLIIVETLLGALYALIAVMVLNLALLLLFPIPPVDWIGIAAVGVAAWAAAKTYEHTRNKEKTT